MLRKNVKFKSLYYIANLIYGVFSDIVLLYHAKIFHYLIAINSMASVAYMNRYTGPKPLIFCREGDNSLALGALILGEI